jgi:Na+/glutamate symporter
MLCLLIELYSLSLSCLIIILSLLVGIKGPIILYLHVTTVVLLVIFAQIIFRFVLKNLGTELILKR